MSDILNFYQGKPIPQQWDFHAILQLDDAFWEQCHGHYGVRV